MSPLSEGRWGLTVYFKHSSYNRLDIVMTSTVPSHTCVSGWPFYLGQILLRLKSIVVGRTFVSVQSKLLAFFGQTLPLADGYPRTGTAQRDWILNLLGLFLWPSNCQALRPSVAGSRYVQILLSARGSDPRQGCCVSVRLLNWAKQPFWFSH